MGDFLLVFSLFGLPSLAFAARTIWKPVSPRSDPRLPTLVRVAAPIAVVVAWDLPSFGIPAILLAFWLLPRVPAYPSASLADRVGWTIFAVGVYLMLTMAFFAMGRGSDRATIQFYARIFLGFAAVAVAGPLGACLLGLQTVKKPRAADPLDAPIGPGTLD